MKKFRKCVGVQNQQDLGVRIKGEESVKDNVQVSKMNNQENDDIIH